MHADLKGARGADAHKGTRTTNTGKGVRGTSIHKPSGGNGRTQGHPPHNLVHKAHYTRRGTWGHTDTCKIQTGTTSRDKKNVFRTEIEYTEHPRGIHRKYWHRNRQTRRNGPKTRTHTPRVSHKVHRHTGVNIEPAHLPSHQVHSHGNTLTHNSSAHMDGYTDTRRSYKHRTEIHP